MIFLIPYFLVALVIYIKVTMNNPKEDSMFFFMTFLLALVWPIVPVIIFGKVIYERI